MSADADNYEFDFDPDEEDEGVDPGLVAFLDQESAEFNGRKDAFAQTFGFEHHCTCAQDYAEGNTTETPDCFGRLCEDAMTACARLKQENDFLTGLIREAIRETNDRTDTPEGLR